MLTVVHVMFVFFHWSRVIVQVKVTLRLPETDYAAYMWVHAHVGQNFKLQRYLQIRIANLPYIAEALSISTQHRS